MRLQRLTQRQREAIPIRRIPNLVAGLIFKSCPLEFSNWWLADVHTHTLRRRSPGTYRAHDLRFIREAMRCVHGGKAFSRKDDPSRFGRRLRQSPLATTVIP